MAMGVFEGHMAKMADGFRAVRQAELELAGKWEDRVHGEELKYFTWERLVAATIILINFSLPSRGSILRIEFPFCLWEGIPKKFKTKFKKRPLLVLVWTS